MTDLPTYTITPTEYRMRLVVGWIDAYWRTHGRAPSMREVGDYVGLSSSHTAMALLCQMRKAGFVRWQDGRNRTVEALLGPVLGSVPVGFMPRGIVIPPSVLRAGAPLEKWARGNARHGRQTMYDRGCRCMECVIGTRERNRGKKARLRARDPGPDRHGKLATYDGWGCRCDPCRAAAAEYHRARRRRKREQANVSTTTRRTA